MNRGKALGDNKRAQLSFQRDNTMVRQIETENLSELSKCLLEKITKELNENYVSNSILSKVLNFIDERKVKGENKNEKMKQLINAHAEKIHEQVDKKVQRYKTAKRKILLRREILNTIDILYIINDMLIDNLLEM